MCSISGFVASRPLDPVTAKRLATALAILGEDRGSQSTGIYTGGRLLKRACDPREFVEGSDFHDLFENGVSHALIHTRQPTSGGRGDAQAQPFVSASGNTVAAHNGYFFDLKGLKGQWEIEKPSGVDSELATSFVDKYGIRKLPKFIETTDGPSALGIWHQRQMYLMRSGNPIYVQFITLADKGGVAIFGSTAFLVEHACHHAWVLKSLDARPLEEGVLFRLEPNRFVRLGKGKVERKTRIIGVTSQRTWRGHDYDDDYCYPGLRGYNGDSVDKDSGDKEIGFHGTKNIDGVMYYGTWKKGVFTPYKDQAYWRGGWRDKRNDGPTLPLPDGMSHLAQKQTETEKCVEEKQSEAISDEETKQ